MTESGELSFLFDALCYLFESRSSWHLSCVCLVSASSLAVVECAGALAQLHPALVITKLIPKLKKEMFTGKLLKISRILSTGTHTSSVYLTWSSCLFRAHESRPRGGFWTTFPSCSASAVSVSSGCSVHPTQCCPGEHTCPPGGPSFSTHR